MSDDRVHTLADLETWSFSGTPLAVVGHPIKHSLSPAMHNAALRDLATREPRFASWRYFKFDIDPADLVRALPKFHAHGFAGLNLTIPHKVIAVEMIARIDPAAAQAGAVNTLRRIEGGYEGFNTDGAGIARAVAEDLHAPIRGSHVILLGAGGAARATAVACLHEGCASLAIGNRTAANLQSLLETLAPLAAETGIAVRGFDLAEPPDDLPADAMVLNGTSLGLKETDPAPIDLSRLGGRPRVFDMIYNPPETPLMRAAHTRGMHAANGLKMLVYQGARALELWSGETVSAERMHEACLAALGRIR